MVRTALIVGSIACVVALAVVAMPPASPVGVAAGLDAAEAPESYTVSQADQCITVEPMGDGSETGVEFYGMEQAPEYSSLGTIDLQRPGTSQVFVQNGSEGHNLVLLHGKFEDSETGGSISMTISGLPESGTWIVEDDSYNGRDDNFVHSGGTSEIDWMWQPDKTDGGVFRGLEADGWEEITIDPAFGEESFGNLEKEPEWPYATDEISAWIVRDGRGGTMTLDTTEPVSIEKGSCGEPPSAALISARTAMGGPVTLNASGSTDPDGSIVEYRWDFDGDGSPDETTNDPTTTHTYNDSGAYQASVTVVDGNGNQATATAVIDVLGPIGGFGTTPTDPDGDGRFEDVNGDGGFDVVDVQALFVNRADATVAAHPDAFDFNGDGTFDVVDVQALFVESNG